MTVGPALAFPGSRTLAAWWRTLAPLQPDFLHVGYLLLHRLEVLTRLGRAQRPGEFPLLLLRALALEGPGPNANHAAESPAEGQLRRLDSRLGLDRPLLLRLLGALTGEGLAQGDARAGWSLAAAGRAALERGEIVREDYQRRTFYFLEPEPAAEGSRREPFFLPLRTRGGRPWDAPADWSFDLGVLRACVAQPPEWKRRWQFPQDVAEVFGAGEAAESASLSAWQSVPVDRPEQLPLVLAAVPGESGPRLVGFPFQPEGWSLETEEPVLALDSGWEEILGWLREEPGPEAWRAAWRQWCRQRALPAEETDTSDVTPADVVVRLRPGTHLRERLQATRSDALKGEAWLLAGAGRLRPAARVELIEG
jgi:hypothetical protein